MAKLPRHALGFAVVGALGFCADAGLLALGLWAGLSAAIARAISTTAALHLTFALNGLYVFGGLGWKTLPRCWAAYMASNLFGALCNYGLFLVFTASRLPVLSERAPAFVLAAVLAMSVNYLGARFLAFRQAGANP